MDALHAAYDVKEQLGKGAYGTVFRAVCRASGEAMAAKVMDKKKLGQTGVKQVEGEVSVQSALKHPGVTQVRETFDDATNVVVVMEIATGGELFKRLTQLKHYSERTACEIMRNFLVVLEYMHSQGVVHRDLKPDNMLLTDPQEGKAETSAIKLADFGFAERFGKDGGKMKKACGTPYYIAPELLLTAVFKEREAYEPPACDMWSAGVILYVLLSGYPPFRVAATDANAKNKLFKQIIKGKVTFDKGQAWDKISEDAKNLITKLLQVDDKQRITAAEALGHPWFQNQGISDSHLQGSLDELEHFAARRKMKGAIFGVEAAFRMMFQDACRKQGVKTINSGILESIVGAQEPLQEIDLTNNYLGPKGIDALASVINSHTGLKALRMRNSLISTEQCVTLCKVLQDPKSQSPIHIIDLSDNPLTHPAGRALLAMLQSRGKVTEIHLDGTYISPALIKKIKETAERNKQQRGK